MRTRRPAAARITVALALAGVLALGACGDDGGDSGITVPTSAPDGTTTTSATADTTTTVPLADPSPDAQLAAAALMTIDDVPAGWVEMPATPDDESADELIDQICPDVSAARDDIEDRNGGEPAEAEADFEPADTSLPSISAITYVFADDELAGEAFGLLSADDAIECLGTAFTQSLGDQGMTVEGPEVGVLDLPIEGVDESAGTALVYDLSDDDESIRLELDVVALRVERTVELLLAQTADVAPFPEGTASVQAAAARLASAATGA